MVEKLTKLFEWKINFDHVDCPSLQINQSLLSRKLQQSLLSLKFLVTCASSWRKSFFWFDHTSVPLSESETTWKCKNPKNWPKSPRDRVESPEGSSIPNVKNPFSSVTVKLGPSDVWNLWSLVFFCNFLKKCVWKNLFPNFKLDLRKSFIYSPSFCVF